MLRRGRARLQGPIGWFLFLGVAFTLGAAAGSLLTGWLPEGPRREAAARLGAALDAFQRGQGVEPVEVALRSARFNAGTAAILWLLGLSVVGIPGVVAVVFGRGLVIGFTVGFLVREQGWRGLLFAAGALLPSHVLVVPVLLALGTVCVAYAGYRRRVGGGGGGRRELGRYTAVVAALAALLALAGLLDGYAGRPLAAYLLGLARPFPVSLQVTAPLLYSS